MSLTTIYDTEDSLFFVGGRGTKAGDANAGGGCTAELWGDLLSPSKALSDIMGANGEPLSDASAWDGFQTACVVTDNGSAKARITKAGAFANCIAGMVANVVSTGVIPDDVNDRFEITAVDPSGNYVDCNFDVATGGTCDIKAGGALDKIQTAADETMANSVTLAHNVDILTNKDETFSGAGDQIDLDTGGGDTVSGTKKRIIGNDDSGIELAAGIHTTIDADSNTCDVFRFQGTVDGIELHHIEAKDGNGVMKAGFSFWATGTGFVLNECRTTGCWRGINGMTFNTRSVTIVGGYYSSDTSSPISFLTTYGVTLKGVVIKSTVNQPCLVSSGYAASAITGCLIIGNGNIACIGIKTAGTYSMCVADSNVIYNVGHGLETASVTSSIVDTSNIIVVAEKVNGKAILFTSGSVLYSDFSCLWALDGAPEASDRWGPYGIGANSIEQNPLFRDVGNDDFRLNMNSPCRRTARPTLGKL